MASLWMKRLLATLVLAAASTGATHAASDAVQLPGFTPDTYGVLYFVLFASVLAIAYGFLLRSQVMRLSPGTPAMQKVGEAIRSGAFAYLRKQVGTMFPLVIFLAIVLYFLFKAQHGYDTRTALGVSFAFLLGVVLSYSAGYIGMGMRQRNVRDGHRVARARPPGGHA